MSVKKGKNVIEGRGYQGKQPLRATLTKTSKFSLFPATTFHFSVHRACNRKFQNIKQTFLTTKTENPSKN